MAKKTAASKAPSSRKTTVAKSASMKPANAKLPGKPKMAAKPVAAKPVAAKPVAAKPVAAKAKAAGGPAKSAGKPSGGKQVEWSYLRANCKTCEKAEAWLAKAGVAIGPRVDARKQTIGAAEGLKLAKCVAEVRVAKGTAVTRLDMKKGAPADAELSKLVIGPTGNLRAPSLRHGNTLVVGFNEQLYGEFFGG